MSELWRHDNPSCKQMEYIRAIELELGVEFTGKTKGEASDFIASHKEDYDKKIAERAERRFDLELKREIRDLRRILWN